MKRTVAGIGLAVILGLCTTSTAAALTFTYGCTIDGAGDGLGTNRCAGGPTIAQVRILDSGLDYNSGGGSSDVLVVEARLQFYDPNPPTAGYQLDTVWLNIDELLLGSGSGNTEKTGSAGIAWHDGPGGGANDFNFIWFARNSSFTGATPIKVKAQSTNASSWKNFDLQLCAAGAGSGQCALGLPVLSSENQKPDDQAWVVLGYLNSGNLYDLEPGDFDFKTTNTNDPGVLSCTGAYGELLSAIKIDPGATSGLFDNCLTASYGPRYGAAEPGGGVPQQVPEPGTSSLLGLAILALAGLFQSRRRRPTLA